MDDDRLVFERPTVPQVVPTASIVQLEHRGDDDSLWYAGGLAYRLHYRDADDRPGMLPLQIDVLDILRLAKYLRHRNPAAPITD